MPITLPDARQLSDDTLQALRLRALHGIELGHSQADLAQILGVCNETISRWWTAYSAKGLESLPGDRTGRPVGSGRVLTDTQAQAIQNLIDQNPPEKLGLPHALWTRRAVKDLIQREYQIPLAERTVGLYLQRWGYSSKKPSRHAKKQDPDEVELWLSKTYPAIERLAAKDNAEILWLDEVGVAADHHPGYGYARIGERATMTVPAPHIRVNQITAISNDGASHFMTYSGSFTAQVFITFLNQLIDASSRKQILIADGLQAHKTPEVLAWVEAHKDRIQLSCLPPYAPEMNPVEYLNNDMKGEVNKAGLPDNRATLHTRIVTFMESLVQVPSHVISYFLHPRAQYAAAKDT